MARLRDLLSVEGPTLLGVAVLLLALEAAFRVGGDRLSGDVAHMESIDHITAELAEAPGVRILFVGNSLVGEGLDPSALASALSDSLGREVDVAVVRPDGSSPLEWNYLTRRYVYEPGRAPDLLVLPFGPGHLFDRDARETVLRLAAHHVAWSDVPELWREDLEGFEPRSQFALARVSRAYALRERVQPRVLDLLIPDYRELAPLILRAPAPAGAGEGGAAESPGSGGRAVGAWRSRTLDQLERVASRAAAEGVPVLYLAMPQAGLWTLDPVVRTFMDGRSPGLLDFRRALDLPPERFPDGEHMDADGRERFTRALAVQMLPVVRQVAAGLQR